MLPTPCRQCWSAPSAGPRTCPAPGPEPDAEPDTELDAESSSVQVPHTSVMAGFSSDFTPPSHTLVMHAPLIHGHVISPHNACDLRLLFYQNVSYLNLVGYISFEDWEAQYGPISHEQIWGESFWPGFEKTMMRYLDFKMYGYRLQDLTPDVFKKPAHFREPKDMWSPELQEGTTTFPCYATANSSDWVKMVCIHIAVVVRRPWTVHTRLGHPVAKGSGILITLAWSPKLWLFFLYSSSRRSTSRSSSCSRGTYSY